MSLQKVLTDIINQDEISDAAVLNIVGENLGNGLTYDSDKTLINASASSGINRTNVAETFTEGDLSVTGTLGVDSGQLAFKTGSTAGPGDVWNSGGSNWTMYPAWKMNNPANAVKFTFPNGFPDATEQRSDNDKRFVLRRENDAGDSYVQVDTFDFANVYNTTDDTLTLTANFESGTTYHWIPQYYDGDFWTDMMVESTDSATTSYPYESTDIDWIGGYNEYNSVGTYATQDDFFGIGDITADPNPTNQSATLEWSTNRDVYEWDRATYQQIPDGETVDVYVSYDDGSGWTRSNSGNPISRGYDLSADSNIDPSDNVRLELELSRSDTANNPRLEAAYLSWQV